MRADSIEGEPAGPAIFVHVDPKNSAVTIYALYEMSLNCLKNVHTLLGHALGMVDAEMNTVFISICTARCRSPTLFMFFHGTKDQNSFERYTRTCMML